MSELASNQSDEPVDGIRRLAGGIAHDFNTFVFLISGLADLALQRAATGVMPKREIEKIRKVADRAGDFARQLLAVSSRQALRPVEVDLNEALMAAAEELRGILGKEIDLRIALDRKMALALVDPEQLERILANLAEVARARMPGGGRFELETAVGVETGEHGAGSAETVGLRRYAALRARDTGPAVKGAARERIFEPYFSASGGPGFGLALAVVRGIVTQSGGRASIREEAGGGACIEILLPAADRGSGQR